MPEDRVQELLAEVEKYKRYFAKLANTYGKEYRSLKQELEATKERLELSESQVRELEAENYRLQPETTVIPLCRHMRENGKPCRAAAVRKQKYCRYHLKHRGRRLKMARARARGERWRVELPPLEDLYAVQVGIQRVLDAVAGEHLERSQAWAMLYGLQQAATNLRLPQEVWENSDRFGDVEEEIEWDTFAKEHGLPEDFDVDTPPDEAFPLPAASAEAADAAKKAPQSEADTPPEPVAEVS
jgi:hypothetical protein